MKRDRLLVGIVLLVLAVALAGVVLWFWTGRSHPPQATPQAEAPRDQQAPGYSFAREASPTQTIEPALPAIPTLSSTGEVKSSSSPVQPQTPSVAVIASNAANAAIEPVKQEESSTLPNESVPTTSADAGIISVAISEFFRLFGTYPTGSNAVIAKALSGQNPKGIVLLSFKRVGKGGELVDPWGTPYDIQVTEDGRLRVHSAGSNLTWGDADDILQEHPLGSGQPLPPAARPR